MPVNIGPRIGIEGEAEFRRQINSLIQQQKTLASEMKAVTSAFDENDNSQEKLTAQMEVLNRQIDVQVQRVKLLEQGVQDSAKQFGEGSRETNRWQEALNNANADLNGMKKQLAALENGVEDLGDEMQDAGKDTVSLGNLIKGNLISETIINGVKSLGSALVSAGKAVVGFIGDAVNQAQEFASVEAQYNQVFKGITDEADAALERAAASTGSLSGQLKDGAVSLYAFAKASGSDTTQGLDLMERALVAAADAAAFNNTTLEETLPIMQSFLKGNYENDAALNLSATEFTRNSAAVELFGKKFQELNEIQKQQTLLKMVEDAQALSGITGQALRESDEWTSSMGRLNFAWDEFLAKVGSPVLEGLIPLLNQATTQLQSMVENVDWETFGTNVEATFSQLQEYISNIDWNDVIQGISDLMTDLAEKGPTIIEAAAAIADGIMAVIDTIGGLWDNLSNYFSSGQAQMALAAGGMAEVNLSLAQSSAQTKDQVVADANEMADGYSAAVNRAADEGENSAQRVETGWAEGVSRGAVTASKDMDEATASMEEDVTGMADTATTESKRAADATVGSAAQAADGTLAEVDRIGQGLSEIAEEAYTWGNHLGQNYAQGILDAIPAIAAASAQAAQASADYMEHSTPKKGPLRDDDIWGYHMMQNWVSGMERGMPELTSSLNAMGLLMRQSMPEVQTTAAAPATSQYGNVYVTIDAKNVKDFNDVVAVFQNHEKVVRQGYTRR